MCKFHKDVARDIATNPVTGAFDAGKFCVALQAMAKFRIEQYMPAMHGCDGFDPAIMTTQTAVDAFKSSGLTATADEIAAFRDANIAMLKDAMNITARSADLTLDGLNIPDNITKDGYQHCAKMSPNITQAGPFMDEAVVQLFEGYDDDAKTWARGPLTLTAAAHKPEFEAIRMATEHFLAQDGVEQTLKTMFEHTLARIFTDAQADLEAGRSIKTDGCVMCGHGNRAPKHGL